MKDNVKTLLKFLSCMALLCVAYIPTIVWMVDRWMAKESYYGHGFLIPIISLYIIWQRKDVLRKIKLSSAAAGIWIIITGLLIHIVCAALKVYFISGLSFVFVIYGLVLFFFRKGDGPQPYISYILSHDHDTSSGNVLSASSAEKLFKSITGR